MNIISSVFVVEEEISWNMAVLDWIGFIVLKSFPWPRYFTVRSMKQDFSAANFRFFSLTKAWTYLISCSICGLVFDVSRISSIKTIADTSWIKSPKNRNINCVQKSGRLLRPLSFLRKANSLSPDENPKNMIVSTSNVACAYA